MGKGQDFLPKSTSGVLFGKFIRGKGWHVLFAGDGDSFGKINNMKKKAPLATGYDLIGERRQRAECVSGVLYTCSVILY